MAGLVRQNDEDARRRLYEAYYGRTYAVALNILRSRESAEDITHDAFIRAFGSLHQLQDASKFGAWLAVIASNLARNHLKREKRIILNNGDMFDRSENAAGCAEGDVLRRLEAERVRNAIRTLPPDQYQVVVLMYFYELKVEEIAGLLKTKAGTVKSRLFRARQKLAETLELDRSEVCLKDKGGGGG